VAEGIRANYLNRGIGRYAVGSASGLQNALVMVALWNRADHYIFMLDLFMVAICNSADHIHSEPQKNVAVYF